METLIIPENYPDSKKDEYYWNTLESLWLLLKKHGEDVIVEDFERFTAELEKQEKKK